MTLTFKITQLKADDVHIIADVFNGEEKLGRYVFDVDQVLKEKDDLNYEIRKAVREFLLANSALKAEEKIVELEKAVISIRG